MKKKTILNWRNTLIESKNIKWKHKFTNVEDGKLDLDLHLPLTELFEKQAFTSFLAGMIIVLKFDIDMAGSNRKIEITDLHKLFTDAGYPEFADSKFKEATK
jgi:hypothetical protein